ncbi:DUF2461 domain-containing protein [Dysgonomonas sp. 216]|uniref:DUF2461 domain-containing protein n=1 Tax=Dysgonomonas sp. 216 TaxID=2302934 RepID=UPI0013CFDE9A|nr:DUF2461 domain-containing protein [Dysgonomonas sp. 216]NDW18178.1 DUF2461 domain-containing protein [Dysgonomonas sp. 216]
MLQNETLNFIRDLKENNNREWFAENKNRYQQARADFEILVAQVIQGLGTIDPQIKHLDPKKCIFRIYRDVRFSSDKSPYKTHFGAVFHQQGLDKTSGYYLHVSPGESFVSSGHYMLMPDQLKKIRKGIYEDFEMFSEILNEKHFKEEFGDLFKDDDMLKRVPNGFDKDHPAAEYMKLKHFYVVKDIPEKKLHEKELLAYVLDAYKKMRPMSEFLNDLLLD